MNKILIIISLLITILISTSRCLSAEEKEAPCLDNPTGYVPNPRLYPEFYNRDNPIHKAAILHRKHLNCSDDSLNSDMQQNKELIIKLHTPEGDYCNYICRNRKQQQCYDDGTFDTYYDEWCEDKDGKRIEVKEQKIVEHKKSQPASY